MPFINNILLPIRESIRIFADSQAFFIDGTYYTYRQFAERISAIRLQICDWASLEQIFAIAIHDDLDTYASIIALWMEGKAYVPLHPNQPLERNLNIIAQVGLNNVLDSESLSVFSDHAVNVISTSTCSYTYDYLDNWLDVPDDVLAYILFTSGSTGLPKGVPLSRNNLSAFVQAFWNLGYVITEKDRCLQCFDLTFDLSIMSYLIPLLRGACVYTIPYDVVKYLAIVNLIQEKDITFALMTPSTIQYLRPYFEELNFPSIRYSLFCGEALPTDVALEWAQCLPNAEIDNVYGPTEDTIFCTWYRLQRNGYNEQHNGILSIGKTMSSGNVLIIDEHNNPVRGNAVGELCLSGKQLTQGYWKNPIKNKEVFWFASDGTRYYRSGDMCFYGQNGNINFIGRKDSQVKIQGFRIELSEIEYYAHQFLGDTMTLVMASIDDVGMTKLVMFIEAQKQDNQPLVTYLASKLPPYMLPHEYIYVDKFPVNSSNKIDRTKLKSLIQ